MPFEKIIGNEKIKELLTKTINSNTVVNAYMFLGKAGIGKMLFAKEFAQSILCQGKVSKPCNKCKSCMEFIGNSNPDISIIEPDGNSIKIEQIRMLNSKIMEKPVTSNKKVYIINDSEKMTVEAQNCLLKTLEEPPVYATIILICCNETKMLTTIKSRCTKITFASISNKDLKQYINDVDDNIISFADGSLGKLLQIKDKQELYSNIEKIINSLENMPKSKVWNSCDIIYKSQDEINEILDYMNILFLNKGKAEEKYLNCIEIVEKAKRRLLSNSNFNMTIDNLLISIWEEINEKYSRS